MPGCRQLVQVQRCNHLNWRRHPATGAAVTDCTAATWGAWGSWLAEFSQGWAHLLEEGLSLSCTLGRGPQGPSAAATMNHPQVESRNKEHCSQASPSPPSIRTRASKWGGRNQTATLTACPEEAGYWPCCPSHMHPSPRGSVTERRLLPRGWLATKAQVSQAGPPKKACPV